MSLDKKFLEAQMLYEKKISDLEVKLAESNESHHKNIVELTKMATEKDRKIEELKQQLAEKTLTIEQINKAFIENRSLWKGKYEKANQDKISFCIEKLEKVKELLFSKAIQITGTSVDGVRLYSINEIFGDQIKQLKEME